ncbi:MAG: glycosyltransferase family 39 protein [Tannerellaceae bacterium]|jgi:hypothetical protein|nr:glycosyltransferase family 39 protein [Tannerellaceae bacterium]
MQTNNSYPAFFKPDNISATLKITVACWLLIQLALIVFLWGHPQGSDQGAYMRIAQECYDLGEWYPAAKHIHADYIWAPGFINYLILQLHLWGTLNINMVLNLVLQIITLWLIFKTGLYFFSRQTAQIAVILWCLLYSNLLIVAPAGTELPFFCLSLMAFYLALSPKLWCFLVAGFLLALANWIRPVMIIFLLAILIHLVWKRMNWKYGVALFFSLVLTIVVIGKATEKKTGYFIYQSTTGGVNLIMTSNDDAYGGVAASVLGNPDNIAYIPEKEKLTFQEKDSIWKARSIEWMLQNPVKASGLYIRKIAGLYVEDSWSDRPLFGGDGIVDSYIVAEKASRQQFITQILLRVLKSLVYYGIFALALYALFRFRKKVFRQPTLILLLLLVMGTAMTCLLAVSPRYHYPFLFVIVLLAAFGLEQSAMERKNRQYE